MLPQRVNINYNVVVVIIIIIIIIIIIFIIKRQKFVTLFRLQVMFQTLHFYRSSFYVLC